MVHVWAQLEDQRLTPDDLAQPETVERRNLACTAAGPLHTATEILGPHGLPQPTLCIGIDTAVDIQCVTGIITIIALGDIPTDTIPASLALAASDQFLSTASAAERTIARERQTTRREPQHDSCRRPPELYMSGTCSGCLRGRPAALINSTRGYLTNPKAVDPASDKGEHGPTKWGTSKKGNTSCRR